MQAIFITNRAQADAQFHLAAPLLQPVVDQAGRGEFTVEDLKRLTSEGRAITMVVEVVMYPSQTAVNIMALGGDRFAEGEAVFGEAFRQWCRKAGATVIEASCSPAMARMLRKFGFDVAYQVVRSKV